VTLKELIAKDRDAIMLNTDELAEDITYLPRDGPSRSVTAVVQERVVYADVGSETVTQQEAMVYVGRDPTSDKGGIDKPRIRDGIQLADGRIFGFTGDRENVHPGSWWLRFTADIPGRAGTEQKQSR
jgi:hypothetical protein